MQCIKNSVSGALYLAIIIAVLFLSGCSTQKTVRFKINSVPKGAHVLYQIVGEGIPCQGQWIYLGSTPIQGVRQLDEDLVEGADKITLRILHRGYSEQVKEWDGPGFWSEVEERDVIFWTPELIEASKE